MYSCTTLERPRRPGYLSGLALILVNNPGLCLSPATNPRRWPRATCHPTTATRSVWRH